MDAFTGIAIGHRMKQRARAEDDAIAEANRWRSRAKRLERNLREERREVAIWKARADGIAAQAKALLQAHPDTPLRGLTKIRWNDPMEQGAFKSKLVLIFEEAHDKKARELGIENPVDVRQD